MPPEDLIDSRRLQYSGLLINDDTGFLQRGHVIETEARRKSELIPEADFPALGPRINPVGTAYVRGRVIPITQGKLHDQLFLNNNGDVRGKRKMESPGDACILKVIEEKESLSWDHHLIVRANPHAIAHIV